MVLSSAGNVGIGTVTPTRKLQVETTSGERLGALVLKSPITGTIAYDFTQGSNVYPRPLGMGVLIGQGYAANVQLTDKTYHGSWIDVNSGSESDAPIVGLKTVLRSSGNGGAYAFIGDLTNVGSGHTRYGAYITGEDRNYFSGKIGIGTTSPSANLHIKAKQFQPYGYLGWSGDTGLLLSGSADDGGKSWVNIRFDGTDSDGIIRLAESDQNRGLQFGVNDAKGTPMIVALQITGTGNVGIKNASPKAALDVRGSIAQGTGAGPISYTFVDGITCLTGVTVNYVFDMGKLDVGGSVQVEVTGLFNGTRSLCDSLGWICNYWLGNNSLDSNISSPLYALGNEKIYISHAVTAVGGTTNQLRIAIGNHNTVGFAGSVKFTFNALQAYNGITKL
jgi:hypothetical protein